MTCSNSSVSQLGVKTLATKLGMSEKEAYRHINQFYTTFPAVKTFQNRVVSDARKSG
jgi:DNA polymerase I-like protein with 3'-5' exonuclease and polymerase domains